MESLSISISPETPSGLIYRRAVLARKHGRFVLVVAAEYRLGGAALLEHRRGPPRGRRLRGGDFGKRLADAGVLQVPLSQLTEEEELVVLVLCPRPLSALCSRVHVIVRMDTYGVTRTANSHVKYQRLCFAFHELLHEGPLPVIMISTGKHLRIPLVHLDIQAEQRAVFGEELHEHLLVAVPGNDQVGMIEQRDEEVLTPLVRSHVVKAGVGRVRLGTPTG